MTKVFADTFFYFALVNKNDPARECADAFIESFVGETVTTGWILTEVADGMSRPERRRETFGQLLTALRADPSTRIVGCSDELLNAGIELFLDRRDKEWSLTDCISFVVMEREGITDALTGDHHFEQAGFRALLK